jgi:Recombination endonuclease VII
MSCSTRQAIANLKTAMGWNRLTLKVRRQRLIKPRICTCCKKRRAAKYFVDPTKHTCRLCRTIRRHKLLTEPEYASLIKKQKGRCSICLCKLIKGKQTTLDHDHSTGKVREILCATCNNMLGCAKDNPDLLRAGIKYLKKHNVRDK